MKILRHGGKPFLFRHADARGIFLAMDRRLPRRRIKYFKKRGRFSFTSPFLMAGFPLVKRPSGVALHQKRRKAGEGKFPANAMAASLGNPDHPLLADMLRQSRRKGDGGSRRDLLRQRGVRGGSGKRQGEAHLGIRWEWRRHGRSARCSQRFWHRYGLGGWSACLDTHRRRCAA